MYASHNEYCYKIYDNVKLDRDDLVMVLEKKA